ncbi:hypothetical protein Dfri01_21820 [Dyadobacter frigoris]|nr:hypothetical protein Dfri01_21820 [Dyadobacter frigoris]
MKIVVIGTVYVGLVTGICFAETENQIACIDIDIKKVTSLQKEKYSTDIKKIWQLFM